MTLRSLSIAKKITFLASLCSFLVVASLLGITLLRLQTSLDLVRSSSSTILDEAAQHALSFQGDSQVASMQRYFDAANLYGQGFARQVLTQRDLDRARGVPARLRRETLVQQTRLALEQNPSLLGLFVVFEPDELDGADAQFKDTNGLGNESGRSTIYWVQRTAGKLEPIVGDEKTLQDATPDTSGVPYNSWYSCPRDNRRDCITEPYVDSQSGANLLITTISFPLISEGKVVGVAGVDINHASENQHWQQINGQCRMVTAPTHNRSGGIRMSTFSSVKAISAVIQSSRSFLQTTTNHDVCYG